MNETANELKARKYKRYDMSFKRFVLEHWLSSGKSAEAIAAGLGRVSGHTPRGNERSPVS